MDYEMQQSFNMIKDALLRQMGEIAEIKKMLGEMHRRNHPVQETKYNSNHLPTTLTADNSRPRTGRM